MLRGRRCTGCGRVSVPSGAACPFCGAADGTDLDLSGRGRLLSWTVIRVAPARYAAEAPYAVGLLELAEGARLTARLEGDPAAFASGQPVMLSAVDPARGPLFRAV